VSTVLKVVFAGWRRFVQ